MRFLAFMACFLLAFETQWPINGAATSPQKMTPNNCLRNQPLNVRQFSHENTPPIHIITEHFKYRFFFILIDTIILLLIVWSLFVSSGPFFVCLPARMTISKKNVKKWDVNCQCLYKTAVFCVLFFCFYFCCCCSCSFSSTCDTVRAKEMCATVLYLHTFIQREWMNYPRFKYAMIMSFFFASFVCHFLSCHIQ